MSKKPRNEIVKYFNIVLRNYEKLRGKETKTCGVPFWDLVVITTADEEQKKVYEEQIRQKHERRELPRDVPFAVISDPEGPKLGNGGSTLTAISFLNQVYGKNLFNFRVLLIHAGGQSQRMPSASVLGKIFSPIPIGEPIYQMLDVKLAMYLPLIPKMGPGIFVTCADDFLVYNLGHAKESKNIIFGSEGFTVLAHPSTVEIGTKHGVYVIKDIETVNPQTLMQMCECLEVLQKPSEEVMMKKGAILATKDLKFRDGIQISGSAAYTDSSFFFAHDITRKFLSYIEANGLVTCEICAYGDFLQALGPQATSAYIHNTSNVSTVTPDLIPTRERIFHLLKGSELKVLVMNSSKFIHIGTTKEYIEYYCFDKAFQEEMNLSKDVFNHWMEDSEEVNTSSKNTNTPSAKRSGYTKGCVMHSVLPLSSVLSESSVVEYSHFEMKVNIGDNVIVSNCKLESKDLGGKYRYDLDPSGCVQIPDSLFLHTIPICSEPLKVTDSRYLHKENENPTSTKYVTIFLDIEDNLKKVAADGDVLNLSFLGRTVRGIAKILDMDVSQVTPDPNLMGSKVNLWYSNLFPVVDSMSESLSLTLETIRVIQDGQVNQMSFRGFRLVSLAAILKTKDVQAMLKHRNDVFKLIRPELNGSGDQ